jgi:hypothetical protein
MALCSLCGGEGCNKYDGLDFSAMVVSCRAKKRNLDSAKSAKQMQQRSKNRCNQERRHHVVANAPSVY